MKPFDLTAALAGAPVVTVSGSKVTGLHKFEGVHPENQSLFGVQDGEVNSWNCDGSYFCYRSSTLDLRMAEGDEV
jgi:hypothetical protein